MPASRPITAWLTLLVMSWAAIWCCCVAPAVVATAQAKSAPRRTCCTPTSCVVPGQPPATPANPFDCPIIQTRLARLTPADAPVPAQDLVAALPDWLAVRAILLPPTATAGLFANELLSPRPPPTSLLALHTSLVC